MNAIMPHETNVLYFSALLPEKFPDEFARIQAILDKYGIDYRFLKGTRDIWCHDYMPVQIAEKDFIQFRYQPTYLKTKQELSTRSHPRLVNPENGFNPNYSNINLDGGNVVRYKETVMITARVYKENQNSGLSKEEIRDQLGKELRAHVIIIPEHPADQVNINAIAEEGGLLNCITWNIKLAKQ
jgi:agmatine deiminase